MQEKNFSLLNEIPELPAIHLKPNLDAETILLRDIVNNQKVLVDYEEDVSLKKLFAFEQLINVK